MLALEPPRAAGGHGPAAVVAAAGEIDIATGAALRRRLVVALDEHPAVAVDMSAVTFIDCAGLRALLAARNHADRQGRHLTVHNPSRPVRRLLALTRLDRYLRTTP